MCSVLGDPVEIRVDGVAERGERDEGLALKKRAAKFLLQRHGIGQRGLGNAAAFGRAGETTLPAKRQKVADLVHLHVPPRGINRACRPRLPSAPVSKCEVVSHTEARPLPDHCEFDILQSAPGWRGPNAIRSVETAGAHRTSRRRGVALPLAARAQPTGKLPTIGYLHTSTLLS